jgi:RNA polymerase sigma-B factor
VTANICAAQELDTVGAGDVVVLQESYWHSRDADLEGRLLAHFLPMARRLAVRFGRRGEPLDDLFQVASLGLLAALRRFDPGKGVPFASFASVTMAGELKRHFRDHCWSARVGRRLQELHLELREAADQLTASAGRSPTIGELARYMEVTEEDVIAAMEAGHAYQPMSIDASVDDGGQSLLKALGVEDGEIDRFDGVALVNDLLSRLSDRERDLVRLRFEEGMSQTQIARKMGVSQMHVSRLLARTVGRLRVLAVAAEA